MPRVVADNTFYFRMPNERVKRALRIAAAARDTSMQDLVSQTVSEWLRQHGYLALEASIAPHPAPSPSPMSANHKEGHDADAVS